MKKILFLSVISLAVTSCSMKDSNGNAPLIEDENGYLVDNPNYKTDQQIKYDEAMEPAREAYKKTIEDGSNVSIIDPSNPTVEEREKFAKTFKSKTGKNEITLSGKNKTTIKFTGAFNVESTSEQFDNLEYFSKLEDLGFKKVTLSNGVRLFTREI